MSIIFEQVLNLHERVQQVICRTTLAPTVLEAHDQCLLSCDEALSLGNKGFTEVKLLQPNAEPILFLHKQLHQHRPPCRIGFRTELVSEIFDVACAGERGAVARVG